MTSTSETPMEKVTDWIAFHWLILPMNLGSGRGLFIAFIAMLMNAVWIFPAAILAMPLFFVCIFLECMLEMSNEKRGR